MREVLLLTAKVLGLVVASGSIFCYTFREELKQQIAFFLDLLNTGRVTEERGAPPESQNPEAEERKARRLAFWVLIGAIIFSAAEFCCRWSRCPPGVRGKHTTLNFTEPVTNFRRRWRPWNKPPCMTGKRGPMFTALWPMRWTT
jgi:hypothetical protein